MKSNKKEKILDLFFNEHLKQVDIANIVGATKQYISQVLNEDSRYKDAKQKKLEKSAIERKIYMKDYLKDYNRPKHDDNSYEQLKAQQYQDSLGLSYSGRYINDYAFAKCNPSIYHRDKNGNLKLNKGIKVSSDVPKSINMNIAIPTQKYKYKCYNM